VSCFFKLYQLQLAYEQVIADFIGTFFPRLTIAARELALARWFIAPLAIGQR